MSDRLKSKVGNQRERIIMIASHLMAEKGYKGTSVQEIADLVGIHKSTLFHYFKNKEELLQSVLSISIQEVTENLKLILKNEDLSPEEKLKEAIINHIVLLAKYVDNVNVYHNEMRFLTGKRRRQNVVTRNYYASCFKQIIDEVKESDTGYFKGLNSKIVTLGILGMCNWMIKWFNSSGEFAPIDIANIFYQMIIKGNDS